MGSCCTATPSKSPKEFGRWTHRNLVGSCTATPFRSPKDFERRTSRNLVGINCTAASSTGLQELLDITVEKKSITS